MSLTEIENYEPSDEGWGVVIGRLAQPPPVEVDDSREETEGEGE